MANLLFVSEISIRCSLPTVKGYFPMQLAGWVKSLEKNACFVVFGGPFGEGGYLCKKWPSGQGRVPLGQEVADASPCLVNGMIYTASLQRQFFMRRQAVLFPADVAIIFHGRFVQFQMAIAGG